MFFPLAASFNSHPIGFSIGSRARNQARAGLPSGRGDGERRVSDTTFTGLSVPHQIKFQTLIGATRCLSASDLGLQLAQSARSSETF
jgi:hypothetical protein